MDKRIAQALYLLFRDQRQSIRDSISETEAALSEPDDKYLAADVEWQKTKRELAEIVKKAKRGDEVLAEAMRALQEIGI